MRKGDRIATIWALVTALLTFIAGGFALGLEYVGSDKTYFVFQNIIAFSYALIGISAVVALVKYFSHISISLIATNIILSFGRLYFIEHRTYHRLLVLLLLVAIIYTAYYWISFLIQRRDGRDYEKLRHINGIIPLTYIAFYSFIVGIRLLSIIESEMDVPMGFIVASLILSVVALILGIVFIKDRGNRKEYFGKLSAAFFLTLVITFVLPLLTIEYTNYAFDTSVGEAKQCLVVEKHITQHRRGKGYYIEFVVNGERVSFSTDKLVYLKYDVGDRISIYEYDGAYDMKYYEYRLDKIYKYNE